MFGYVEGDEVILDLREAFLVSHNAPIYYQYLADSEQSDDKIDSDDLNDVVTISFQYNPNTYHGAMVFDLIKKKAYFESGGHLLEDGVSPMEEMELSDEQVEELRNLLIENHVEKWKKRYSYTDEYSTGSFWWQLIYELNDGRIFIHSGSNASPSNYREVAETLKAFFNAPC